MEVEEIQTQACKFPRIGNGRMDSTKIAQKDQYPEDDEDGEQQQHQQLKRASAADAATTTRASPVGDNSSSGANSLRNWHQSSRIIRVSRASGGKDRHSKVWTSKGLRDRRVRLSVATAIQFYDLQDRLGYDQPSKAVEWLIKSATDSIAELPSLNSTFPETPKELSDDKRASEGTDEQGFDSVELNGEPSYQQNQSQHRSLSKSACSSNSETSKGSGLSLSRSETRANRVKGARQRAKERSAAKEKVKENESRINAHHHHHQNVNTIPQSSSFTELLTAGIGNVNNNNTSPTGSSQHQDPNGEPFFHKAATGRSWSAVPAASPMDYLSTALMGPSSSRGHHFSGQIQLGGTNSFPQTMSIPFNLSNENHPEMQHFSLVPETLIPVTTTQPGPGADYNLNFTISPGLAGFNRGTLQSNSSPSLLPHIQRFGSSSPIDGSNVPFFIGTTPSPVENHHHQHHHHHQFAAGFDGRLQLYYGDGSRHSDHKGKAKN